MRIRDMIFEEVTIDRTGFTVLALFFLLISVIGCEDEQDPITAELPVFSVTPVDMTGPYDPTDSTFGDIKFIDPVILPFGAVLDQHSLSPAIEYYTDTGAVVRAVCEGLVSAVIENPFTGGNYEIRVTALPGSDYTIIYDNILRVNVLESQLVYPGDTIGQAGDWTDIMRRTELQVTLGEGNDTRAYCPLNYGDSAFVAAHRALLSEYNNRGFIPAYDTLCLIDVVEP